MEKKIIEGKQVNVKTIAIIIFLVLACVASVIVFASEYSWNEYHCASWDWSWDWVIEKYGENANVFTVTLHDVGFILICIFLGAALLGFLFYLMFGRTELIVTDKRVYGKTSFGKRVDLPFDSISAVGTALMKSIAVTTSSGAIKFALIANSDEIHRAISQLLIERQEKKASAAPVAAIKQEGFQSNAEELKKYKELLDSGVITQEEFDAKKKQLLGL